jgi:hypothetical protein
MSLLSSTITGSANGNSVTTSGINTAGATLLVAVVCETAGTVATPTDLVSGNSNSWTPLTNRDTTTSTAIRIFYSVPSFTGASHTLSYTHNSAFPAIAFLAFDATLGASPFDTDTGNVSVVGATSAQPGSISPAVANEVFVTGIAYAESHTMAIDSSFTISGQHDYLASSNNFGLAVAYRIISGSTAQNPTWSWTSGSSPSLAMAAFKPSVGGGGGNLTVLIGEPISGSSVIN